jgi:hypothetical protein
MFVRSRLTLGDGRHEPFIQTVPPSRMLITPSRPLTLTVTRTLPSPRPTNRKCQLPGLKHIHGEVADEPAGIESDLRSCCEWM